MYGRTLPRRQLRKCEQCGSEFLPSKPQRRFCSNTCSGTATARARGQIGQVDGCCAMCGKRWRDYAGNNRVYCSFLCASEAKKTERPKCKTCGAPVKSSRNGFCSKRCRGADDRTKPISSWAAFYETAQRLNPNPMPCSRCGRPGKHRHHPDYSKPEVIEWLCGHCHINEHHRGKRRGSIRVRPDRPPAVRRPLVLL